MRASRSIGIIWVSADLQAGEAAALAATPAAEEEEATPPEPVEVEWPHDRLDTVDGSTFYLDVARAGIQYGPHFRMVQKRHLEGSAVVLRCAPRNQHSCSPGCHFINSAAVSVCR